MKNLFYLPAMYTRPTPACLEPHVFASVPTSVCLGSKDRTFYLDVVQNIGLYLGQEVVKVDCRVIILILKSPLPRYFSLHAWNFLLCCTHLCLPYLLFNLSCTGYVMLITPNVLPIQQHTHKAKAKPHGTQVLHDVLWDGSVIQLDGNAFRAALCYSWSKMGEEGDTNEAEMQHTSARGIHLVAGWVDAHIVCVWSPQTCSPQTCSRLLSIIPLLQVGYGVHMRPNDVILIKDAGCIHSSPVVMLCIM